jgi:hypothetical protein
MRHDVISTILPFIWSCRGGHNVSTFGSERLHQVQHRIHILN